MKMTIYISILLLALTSCGVKTSDKNTIGICCDKTYTNIDSALNCFSRTSNNPTGYDERLLLIAFVNKDIKANQNLGWDILKDEEIINVAKQKYLLITLDINQTNIPKDQNAPELLEIIKSNKDKTCFVITNSALYPFGNWTADEKKDEIISRLEIGNGP
jgi:hypothetical protein